jgi:GMP synthase (glutamine-hydrolysing)
MFDADAGARGAASSRDGIGLPRDLERRPVVVVLHQLHSNAGHIGQWLRARGYALDVRRPRFGDPLPDTLEHHAGAIIFGGPMSANDAQDFVKVETEWVGVALRENKPFLGVCLGAQMMANYLGAPVYGHPDKLVEIGYHPIRPSSCALRFGSWPERVYQWHREGFELPHSATILAVSEGPFANQAYAYGTAVGVQFHPEITYAMVSRWSARNSQLLAQRGAQDRPAQLADHIVHGPVVRRWLDSFLSRWISEPAGQSVQPCVMPRHAE